MRNGQNNKRMRGRNRNHNHKSHGGGGGGGGGGGHHHNPLTRVYESNGPEVKIRGTAHHVAEKYLQLARDAQSAGDPVTAENHFQHAEHYLRLIAAAQEQFRQQNPYYQAPPAPGQGAADEVFDGDDDDGSQPTQIPGNFGQPSASQPNFNQQGQPPQNYNNAQNYSSGQQNFNNQQPNYQPREQQSREQQSREQQSREQPSHEQQPREQQPPQQPYGGQPSNYQPRPQQHQPYNNSNQPQYQPPQAEQSDGERLPSFITGTQPQQAAPQNGGDGNEGGDRYPRHRRRRHRSGPRPEMASAPQDFGGDTPEPSES
jgi:hypothetical protein